MTRDGSARAPGRSAWDPLGEAPTPDASSAPAAETAGAPARAQPRILLAEDDREMRRALAWGLRRSGYDVREFADARDLADHIAAHLVRVRDGGGYAELIISDVHMPGGSGLGLLEGLREFDGATPVILITAFGSASTHAAATALGACVLDKPFDLEDLLAVVRSALASRGPGPKAGEGGAA